jgi:hypothetical protein
VKAVVPPLCTLLRDGLAAEADAVRSTQSGVTEDQRAFWCVTLEQQGDGCTQRDKWYSVLLS